MKRPLNAAVVAAGIVVTTVIYSYVEFGWPPVLILGGSGLLAFALWYRTSLRQAQPEIILPLFLLTFVGFEVHLTEEYVGHYAPAISRLFNIGWTEQSFVLISCVLAAALSVTALGLFYQKPLAAFVAWLFFVSRLAELGLFVFPLMRPAIEPSTVGAISRYVTSGAFVADMPNYYYPVAGRYYFAGMYTVALPIVPALYAIYRLWQRRTA